MDEQLTDNEKKAVEIALQAGKMSVMTIYDDLAQAIGTTPDRAKEMLDDLVKRGVLNVWGEGTRNVGADPHGQSQPVAWYTLP